MIYPIPEDVCDTFSASLHVKFMVGRIRFHELTGKGQAELVARISPDELPTEGSGIVFDKLSTKTKAQLVEALNDELPIGIREQLVRELKEIRILGFTFDEESWVFERTTGGSPLPVFARVASVVVKVLLGSARRGDHIDPLIPLEMQSLCPYVGLEFHLPKMVRLLARGELKDDFVTNVCETVERELLRHLSSQDLEQTHEPFTIHVVLDTSDRYVRVRRNDRTIYKVYADLVESIQESTRVRALEELHRLNASIPSFIQTQQW